MAAVSHARFHPPAPPTAISPPTAVWEANDSKSKSVSPAFMRPLYASCRDHYRAHHRQQFRWQQPQQQRQSQPGPPSPQACEHHHQRHHHNPPHLPPSSSSSSNLSPAASSTPTSAPLPPPPSPPVHQFLVLNELPRMPSADHSTFSATNFAPTVPTAPTTIPSVSISPTVSSAASKTRVQPVDQPSSPFLRLPVEIRLQIYALLVLPSRDTDLIPSYERVASSTQDYYDYEKTPNPSSLSSSSSSSSHRPMLLIRTIDPERYHERHPPSRPHARSIYSVRASRFRSRCMQTTYHCVNVPRIEHNLAILRANKQIHAEAAELLYSSYTFDFDTHVEAVVPFLADLSPLARSSIRALRLVKRALAYDKDFDRAEWSNALRYLTSATADLRCLRRLELGVVAGRPGPAGWDRVAAYSAADFSRVRSMEGMEWLQYLLEFAGLRELDVRAVVEHCPPVTSSSAMANYVRFSASVESGFAEFLRAQLLGPAAGAAAQCKL